MNNALCVTFALTFKRKELAQAFCGGFPASLQETARFPGSIIALQHASQAHRVLMIHTWDSEEAFDAYLKWRVEHGTMDTLGVMVSTPPAADRWNIVSTLQGNSSKT